MLLRDVIAVLSELYPPATAQSWDRVGLVTGDLDQPVRHVHFALDPTLAVIAEAAELGADLLVTHHPLLLRGVHGVATTTAKGACVTNLIVSDLALWVAHTNADVADRGVDLALAQACGLTQTEPLSWSEGQPLGRVGDLPEALTLRDFAHRLADGIRVGAGGLRVAGDPEALVRRIAVAGGSGDDRFEHVRASGADVYVTADLRHHPVLEAREESRDRPPYLIDAGHFASEAVWLPWARDALRTGLGVRGADLDYTVSELSTDPWTFTVGARA